MNETILKSVFIGANQQLQKMCPEKNLKNNLLYKNKSRVSVKTRKTSVAYLRIVASVLFFISILTGCGNAPMLEQTAIFTSGTDGYHTYRIPALVITSQGSILAFCEGRKNTGGDAGDIDLLLKRSEDGGRSWSEQQIIWDDGGNVCGNPSPVVDEETGTIWLLMTWNHGADHEEDIINKRSKDTRRVFVTSSQDDGKSWAEPQDITPSTKNPDWGWYATGPGHGIQLKDGPHKGRLIIPCDHSYNDPENAVIDNIYGYGSHIIYSDDRGANWQLGGVIRPKANECQVVELADGNGTLLMNMRSYFGRHLRTQSISKDGGLTWTAPVDVAELVEPVCQASIVRFTVTEQDGRNRLLFANPANKTREKLTIKMSSDEGKTWPDKRLLYAGPAAYSDLAVSTDKTVYCLYERGTENPYEEITFAKFNLEWLTEL